MMAAAPDLKADREQALRLTPVSRETAERLDRYVDVLLQWQKTTNLIAPSTIPELWTRHIADSLQLVDLAPQARIWADLGSGAGFPGLVIAAVFADDPAACVHLVESNTKKAAFLRAAARHIGVTVQVHPVRIEDFVVKSPPRVDAVTARALAPLEELIKLSKPLIEAGALGLFLKGQDVEAELTLASKSWMIEYQLVPSKTHPRGRVVVVRRVVRRNAS